MELQEAAVSYRELQEAAGLQIVDSPVGVVDSPTAALCRAKCRASTGPGAGAGKGIGSVASEEP